MSNIYAVAQLPVFYPRFSELVLSADDFQLLAFIRHRKHRLGLFLKAMNVLFRLAVAHRRIAHKIQRTHDEAGLAVGFAGANGFRGRVSAEVFK